MPSTAIRTTQNISKLMRIPEEWFTKPTNDEVSRIKKARLFNRRTQIETYLMYKDELNSICKRNDFKLPHAYFAMWFYIRVPKSWRMNKVEQFIGMPHQSTPDLDNYTKGLWDGIMPKPNKNKGEKGSSDDRLVHCFTAFKVWSSYEDSCIDIVEYSKDEFMEQFAYDKSKAYVLK
jgi:Holliday junction resolvase RusA-like endonuclease